MRIVRVLTALIASAFLVFTNFSAAAIASPDDLTGTWIGTWTSLNATTYNGAIEMSIVQQGNNIFGKSLVGNTKCSPERSFKGILSGKYDNFIELEIAPADTPETPIATNWGAITRDRNAISVVYNFDSPTSACYGDVGTMFISKIQPYSKIQSVTK